MFGIGLAVLVVWWPLFLALGGALYLGLRYVRAVEGRSADKEQIRKLEERLQLVEDGLSSVTESVEAVTEGQAFTERLLRERSG